MHQCRNNTNTGVGSQVQVQILKNEHLFNLKQWFRFLVGTIESMFFHIRNQPNLLEKIFLKLV